MRDLMVKADAVFEGVVITAVLDSGPGKPVFVHTRAKSARWFSPQDPAAASDGWVRGLKPESFTGETTFLFADHAVHLRAVEQLSAWQEAKPTRLAGLCSLAKQYVGIVDRDTGESVGVKMTAAEQDGH